MSDYTNNNRYNQEEMHVLFIVNLSQTFI